MRKPHNRRQVRKSRTSIQERISRLVWRVLPEQNAIGIVQLTSLIMLLFASHYVLHAISPPGLYPRILIVLEEIAGIAVVLRFIFRENGPRDR